MNQTFWKYLAAISVFVCIAVTATWLLWPSSSSESKSISLIKSGSVVVQEKIKEDEKDGVIPEEKKRVSFFAAGDVMLDRTMYLLAQKYNDFGYAFRLISSTLKQADLRMVNLEGPITTNKSISNGVGGVRFSFTFSPKVTSSLKANFDIVSLANNHTDNFGAAGLAQTRKFLDEAGILHFGDPVNAKGKISNVIEKNGIRIGFVGFHELSGQGFQNVVEEAERLDSEVDILIAYPHWGTEYIMDRVNTAQKNEAHALIDAGVDVVIGAHPHVIQPIEIYNGKPIFYSLGNFVFDQSFSYETMRGLLLGGFFEKSKEELTMHFNLIPIYINKESQPELAEENDGNSILRGLATVSNVSVELKSSIEQGMIEFTFPLTDTK